MTLQIVWRSPLPLIGTERTLQRVSSDRVWYGVCGQSRGSGERVRSDTGRSCLNSMTKLSDVPSEAHDLVPASLPARAPQISGSNKR
jgi:hypothetical protein